VFYAAQRVVYIHPKLNIHQRTPRVRYRF